MADNVTLNAGSGGAVVAADDVSSVYYQRVKLDAGGDGVSTPILAGEGAATSSLRVDLATDGTVIGAVTETAPATDTASSGLNGRLQRIAQRLTSLIALLPAALGAGGGIKVDGSGTALPVSGSLTTVSTVSTITNVVHVDDNSSSLTVDNAALAVTGGGVEASALRVTLASDSTGVISVDDNGGALTVDGTVAATQSGTWTVQPGNTANTTAWKVDGSAVTQPVSVASIPSHAVTNAGTFATQVDGAALTALQLIDDPVLADDAAFTPATSKVMMAGFEADETATDSVDEGDGGAARMTLDRKIITTVQPHTAGGLSTFMASGSDGSTILQATAQAIKASAGQIYSYYAYNPEAAVTFVHFYDVAAASVTVGTTNPLFTLAIPAGAAANLALPNGIVFGTAISCAATTTAGGNTAPATGVSLVAWYK